MRELTARELIVISSVLLSDICRSRCYEYIYDCSHGFEESGFILPVTLRIKGHQDQWEVAYLRVKFVEFILLLGGIFTR